MNVQFRSRIGESISYTDILNYGICCQGLTRIGMTGEHDFISCYNEGGIFIPYDKTVLPGNATTELAITPCPDPLS